MLRHEEWLRTAELDLRLAKMAYESPDLGVIQPAIYHTQQCAEKAFKEYLVFSQKRILKTHDLLKLLDVCIEIDAEFDSLFEDALQLNPLSTAFRYPEDAFLMPDKETLRISIEEAARILEFVCDKVELTRF